MKQALTYQYRLYPTKQQEQQILRVAEASRRYYNAIRNEKTNLFLQTSEWKRKITILENMEQYAAAHNVEKNVLQYAATEFDHAFRRYLWISRTKTDQYKESAKGRVEHSQGEELNASDLKGYPEEKPWNAARRTFSVSPSLLLWQNNAVMLPDVGWAKAKLHRMPPEGARMDKCTVLAKSSGRYYILLEFILEVEDRRQHLMPDEALGIIFCPGFLAIRSDGEPVPVRHTDPALEEQIRRAYQTLRRRTPGSKRYEKQRRKLARLYEKQRARRWDTLHKASRDIVDAGKYIGIQVPAVRKMADQHKRDHMDAIVKDEAWYTFYAMLKYKAECNGLPIYPIPRAYPIWRTCAACGYQRSKTPHTDAWICPRCGILCGKAGNAARNIQRFMEKEIRTWRAVHPQSGKDRLHPEYES